MLKLDLMSIHRAVVHTIPSRAADKSYVPPSGGTDLLTFTPDVGDVVVGRVTQALGHRSHGVQVDFIEVGDASMFSVACSMMDCDDAQFVVAAQSAAERLTRVQQAKSLKPAKLISMSGTVTAHSRPFVAFIKAELQEALSETKQGGHTVLEIFKNLFLTEANKLYKIGFLSRTVSGSGKSDGAYDPELHNVHIFDHLLTGLETRSAAFYFYNEFLGCDLAASDRRLTRDFFEKTLEFVNDQKYPPGKRIALGEALRAELRSNKGQISTADFAKTHLSDVKDQQAYVAYMTNSGFPSQSVTKDVEYVKSRLKRRQRLIFSNDVIISTPADTASDLLNVKDNKDGTTSVTIKGTIRSSE